MERIASRPPPERGLKQGDGPNWWLLVQQLLDPAQRAAKGLGISASTAQRQHGLELRSDGIRYGLQRFRVVSLRFAALTCARHAID